MSMYAGKQSKAESANASTISSTGSFDSSVGKRTLVEQTHGSAVQRRANADGAAHDDAAVHAAAARGIATSASALPHADAIQRSFGHHDISSVQAHVGHGAAASAGDMGADAYATGHHVVLGKRTDLFTVAHEAAHVVQQRGGVQLKGGVGEASDAYEQHANEVASLVVAGKSAEGLLDRYAGGTGGRMGAPSQGAGSSARRPRSPPRTRRAPRPSSRTPPRSSKSSAGRHTTTRARWRPRAR